MLQHVLLSIFYHIYARTRLSYSHDRFSVRLLIGRLNVLLATPAHRFVYAPTKKDLSYPLVYFQSYGGEYKIIIMFYLQYS